MVEQLQNYRLSDPIEMKQMVNFSLDVLSEAHTKSDDFPYILLVAQAAYHLGELQPIQKELKSRGIGSYIVAPTLPKKYLNRFRPSFARRKELLQELSLKNSVQRGISSFSRAQAVVVLNDWGTTTPLIHWAREKGIPVFGWVEGAQDFLDLDTEKNRTPYKSVDHVFCLGSYDYEALSGTERTIVGSNRLRSITIGTSRSSEELSVVANLNFTYGVGSQHRRLWINSVRTATKKSGHTLTISPHIADPSSLLPWIRSSDPIDELFKSATYFVTRFSTLCYESLLRGVPTVYHNPHGEKVKTFSKPKEAFHITTSTEDLIEVLKTSPLKRHEVREKADEFLLEHLRLESGPSPAELAGNVIYSKIQT